MFSLLALDYKGAPPGMKTRFQKKLMGRERLENEALLPSARMTSGSHKSTFVPLVNVDPFDQQPQGE